MFFSLHKRAAVRCNRDPLAYVATSSPPVFDGRDYTDSVGVTEFAFVCIHVDIVALNEMLLGVVNRASSLVVCPPYDIHCTTSILRNIRLKIGNICFVVANRGKKSRQF